MAIVRHKLLGLNKVFRNLNKEIRKLEGRTQAGVTMAAQFIKGEAQKEVPVVEGNLRASVFVAWPMGLESKANFKGKNAGKMGEDHSMEINESKGRVGSMNNPVAEIGFSANYAVKVHENPNAGKTSGKNASAGFTTSGNPSKRKTYATKGKWKFLEDPLKRNTKRILDIIRMKARIK